MYSGNDSGVLCERTVLRCVSEYPDFNGRGFTERTCENACGDREQNASQDKDGDRKAVLLYLSPAKKNF